MRNTQFAKLPSFIERHDAPIALRINSGPYKGQMCQMVKKLSNRILAGLDDGSLELFDYTALDELDENGDPVIVAMTDMTGREVQIGDWCVLLKNSKINIGRISRLTRAGSVIVKVALVNGERINNWRKAKTVSLSELDRLLLLPVTDAHLVEWMLKDFEGLTAV